MNKKISSKIVEGGESQLLNTSDDAPWGGGERGTSQRQHQGAAWTLQSCDLTPQGRPSRQSADKLHCVGTFTAAPERRATLHGGASALRTEATVGRTAAQVTERQLRAGPVLGPGEHRPCGQSGLWGPGPPPPTGPRLSGEPLTKAGPWKEPSSRLTVDSRGQSKGRRQRLLEAGLTQEEPANQEVSWFEPWGK